MRKTKLEKFLGYTTHWLDKPLHHFHMKYTQLSVWQGKGSGNKRASSDGFQICKDKVMSDLTFVSVMPLKGEVDVSVLTERQTLTDQITIIGKNRLEALYYISKLNPILRW